jgi:HEAT repeat protein
LKKANLVAWTCSCLAVALGACALPHANGGPPVVKDAGQDRAAGKDPNNAATQPATQPAGASPATRDGLAWGFTVYGLQAGLDLKEVLKGPQPGAVLRFRLRNAGDKPVRILRLSEQKQFWGENPPLQVKVDGKLLQYRGPVLEPLAPPPASAYNHLGPGEIDSVDATLVARHWGLADPAKAEAVFVYVLRSRIAPGGLGGPIDGLWAGEARSIHVSLGRPATQPAASLPAEPIPDDLTPEVRSAILDLYSGNPEKSAYAAVRLGEMGERSLPALPHLLRPVRDVAAGRMDIGANLCSTLMSTEALVAIHRMGPKGAAALADLLRTPDASRRAGAAWAMLTLWHPALREHLPALLHDKDRLVRACAANAAGRFKDPNCTGRLIELVKTEKDIFVLDSAAWALGELKAPESFEPLLDALRRELPARSPCWVSSSLRAVHERDERTLAVLLEGARSADVQTRCNALDTIGWVGDPGALSAVLGALGDGNARVRSAAAYACACLGDERATRALAQAMKDSDAGVREQVAHALGFLRGPDSMEALVAATKDPEASVRGAAIAAVHSHWVTWRPSHSLPLTSMPPRHEGLPKPYLSMPPRPSPLQAMVKSQQVKERAAYVNRMIECGAVRAMVEALKDPSADVRRYAADGLRGLSGQNLGESHAKWLEWYDSARPASGPATQPADGNEPYRQLYSRYKEMILKAAKAGDGNEVARLTSTFSETVGGKLLYVCVQRLKPGEKDKWEMLLERHFSDKRMKRATINDPTLGLPQVHFVDGVILILPAKLGGGRYEDDVYITMEVEPFAAATQPPSAPATRAATSRAAELTEEEARILAARLVNEYLVGKEFKVDVNVGGIVPKPTWTQKMWDTVQKKDGRWQLTWGKPAGWSASVSFQLDGSDAKVEVDFAAD